MTSLLDDAIRMLKEGYGDHTKLQQIKNILEKNQMLCVADRKYLLKLVRDHPENQKIKISQYGMEKKPMYSLDEDLEIDELEEKIRVESEPS